MLGAMPSSLRTVCLALPLTGALSLAPACVSDDSGDDEHSEHADGDTGSADCSTDDRADDYAVGLSKTGESLTVTFVSADPAPPAIDDNSWIVSVTDGEGAAVDNATIVVTPWMPSHGHGSAVEAVVTELDTPGEYELDPVNLHMLGLWEVTLDISAEGGVEDSLSFGFCIQ